MFDYNKIIEIPFKDTENLYKKAKQWAKEHNTQLIKESLDKTKNVGIFRFGHNNTLIIVDNKNTIN